MYKPKAIRAQLERVGGLSNPSKMPGFSTSTPASKCKTGGKLRAASTKERPTVCGSCYAFKGMYPFPNVQAALQRRLEALESPTWVSDFVDVLNYYAEKGKDVFRWHDSGDVQDYGHMVNICEVARRTPTVRHWLPTREYRIARQAVDAGIVPSNLVIRVSAALIDGKAPDLGLPTSTVHKTGAAVGFICGAPTRDGHCGDCRACWSPKVANVSYHVH